MTADPQKRIEELEAYASELLSELEYLRRRESSELSADVVEYLVAFVEDNTEPGDDLANKAIQELETYGLTHTEVE